jgi:hypothetical protein
MDRKRDLREKIHILDNDKLNDVGKGRSSLSHTWYTKARSVGNILPQLQKNISNVFKNIFHATSKECLWTSFKNFKDDLSGKGYASAFTVYNLRASNKYASRKYLAYCVNNFPRPLESKYFHSRGIEIDADMYALSILVQWIFRSAIRNNEEVWIYIPSERMRYILKQWLENLANGEDLKPICYHTPRKNYYKIKKNLTKEAKSER